MIPLKDEMMQDYLAESREQLNTIEADLIALELGGAEIDPRRLNRVGRALHAIKSAAVSFDLAQIRELAHWTERALALIRSRQMLPTPTRMQVLLRAVDALREMVEHPREQRQADLSTLVKALEAIQVPDRAGPSDLDAAPRTLRVLIAEDDFASRLMLQSFLSRYGDCHVAVNGREAVAAFRAAIDGGRSYDVICMDIMMPEMDGREAVRQIRNMEEQRGILSTDGAKIIMTTTVGEVREVALCFHELCDAYLMKPIDLSQLLRQLKSYRMVPEPEV